MTDKPVFCIDCKWCLEIGVFFKEYLCVRKFDWPPNVVTGKTTEKIISCETDRNCGMHETEKTGTYLFHCGPEARYFEPKEGAG